MAKVRVGIVRALLVECEVSEGADGGCRWICEGEGNNGNGSERAEREAKQLPKLLPVKTMRTDQV